VREGDCEAVRVAEVVHNGDEVNVKVGDFTSVAESELVCVEDEVSVCLYECDFVVDRAQVSDIVIESENDGSENEIVVHVGESVVVCASVKEAVSDCVNER
jgi:hypothetical protein